MCFWEKVGVLGYLADTAPVWWANIDWKSESFLTVGVWLWGPVVNMREGY